MKRPDKLIERRRVLAPWFVYGWIINIEPFVAQMRADAEWCQSEGFKRLLGYRHATVDNFDKDCFSDYFLRRYIKDKISPYYKTDKNVLMVVHGPLPGTLDSWAPNHIMFHLYDNRTPRQSRIAKEVVGNIQRVLQLRDPVWTVRYDHFHWTDAHRAQSCMHDCGISRSVCSTLASSSFGNLPVLS